MENIHQAVPGVWQAVIVLVVIVLLFGGRKIPELMKGLGQGVKEFKDASKGDEAVNQDQTNDNEKIETK
jgi:sec-independent protein translocase protein TatA